MIPLTSTHIFNLTRRAAISSFHLKYTSYVSLLDQAPGDDSEVILRPCRIFKDPFRPRSDGVDNILVMCDTYTPAGEALPTNTRAIGEQLMCNRNVYKLG